MRTLERNKRTIFYCLRNDNGTDEYGNKKVGYDEPTELRVNYRLSKGDTETTQFGTDIQYDGVMVVEDTNCPITEFSVLFVDTPVTFNKDGLPKYNYVVKRVEKSLNSVSYAISRVDVT